MTTLNATEARARFPAVVGTIRGAELFAAFSIVDLGPKAYAVLDSADTFRACCPSRRLAERAGQRLATEVGVPS